MTLQNAKKLKLDGLIREKRRSKRALLPVIVMIKVVALDGILDMN
jgi:hypothetical protein